MTLKRDFLDSWLEGVNMFKCYNVYSALFVVGTIFGGCAPMLVTSNLKSVVIENASAMNAAKAQAMADVECQKHGKHAIHRPDNVRDGQATYECVR
jgi:hypothetical protein